MFRSAEVIDAEAAPAVADILGTVAELRLAEARAREARQARGAEIFSADPRSAYCRAGRAEGYVAELRGLIASRARSGDLDAEHLAALAGAVLDGRMRLPEGVEPMEAA